MSSAATCIPGDQTLDLRRPSPLLSSLVIVWALMIFTFSISADAPGGESLDALLSKLKYAVRLTALLALSLFCLRRLAAAQIHFASTTFVPLFLFVGWAFLSCGWSARRTDSLIQAINLLDLSLLALTLSLLCRTANDVQRIVRHLCTALLAISVGLLLLRCLSSLHVMERSGSGLFHATNTAATASLGLVLLTAAHSVWHAPWTRTLLMPAVPVHLTVLFLSANRLSIAVTICLVGLFLLIHTHRLLLVLTVFCGCTLGALYLAVDPGFAIVSSIGESIGSYASRGQSAAELSAISGREEMWTAMQESWLESPWMGHGYFVSSANGSLEIWYEDGNWTAHNTVLQVLVSTGVIGLLLLSAGILLPVGYFIRHSLAHRDADGLPLLLTGLALWFGTWGLMNESFMGPLQPESVVFFSLLGIAVGRASALSTTGVQQHSFVEAD